MNYIIIAITTFILSVLLGFGMIPFPFLVFVAAFIAVLQYVPGMYDNYITKSKKKKKIESYLESVKSFLKTTKIIFEESRINETRQKIEKFLKEHEEDPFEIKTIILKSCYPSLNKRQLEYLTIYSLCFDYKKNNNLSYKQIIRNYIESRNLTDTKAEKSKLFLSGYHISFLDKHDEISVSYLFKLETEENQVSALKDIVRNYFETRYLKFFEEKLNKEEDLRKTLIELATEGKISIIGVDSKVKDKIEKELMRKGIVHKPVLILKAEGGAGEKVITESLKQSKVPRIVGTATASNVPKHKGRYAVFLINLKDHPTIFDFIRTKIESKLEESSSYEGLLKFYRLDPSMSFTKVFSDSGELTKETMKQCEETLSFFDSGYAQIDIEDLINRIDIKSEEIILSLLPFNLLVPDICESERLFLIKNYEDVKRVFGVEKLTEWQRVKPEELYNHLSSLNPPEYTKQEANIKFKKDPQEITKDDISKRLLEISKNIVKKSREYAESLTI